jgi:rare lipoprotein A
MPSRSWVVGGRTGWARIVVVVALLGSNACTRALVAPEPGKPQMGVASWYGPGFHGRRTSNGETYDQRELTAAHQTLPFGTKVRVTNLVNGQSVLVRINDRGPFAKNRVIDLSHGAASSIGMVGPGTASVRLDVVERPAGGFSQVVHCVQIGAFRQRDKAESLRAELAARYGDVYVSEVDEPAPLYRVRVGPFLERRYAESRAGDLTRLGHAAIITEEPRP